MQQKPDLAKVGMVVVASSGSRRLRSTWERSLCIRNAFEARPETGKLPVELRAANPLSLISWDGMVLEESRQPDQAASLA